MKETKSDLVIQKLKVGSFVIGIPESATKKCLAKVTSYCSGNPACLARIYSIEEGIARRGEEQIVLQVNSKLAILSPNCYSPHDSKSFNILQDISALLGTSRAQLGLLSTSPKSVVTRSTSNQSNDCVISLVSDSSDNEEPVGCSVASSSKRKPSAASLSYSSVSLSRGSSFSNPIHHNPVKVEENLPKSTPPDATSQLGTKSETAPSSVKIVKSTSKKMSSSSLSADVASEGEEGSDWEVYDPLQWEQANFGVGASSSSSSAVPLGESSTAPATSSSTSSKDQSKKKSARKSEGVASCGSKPPKWSRSASASSSSSSSASLVPTSRPPRHTITTSRKGQGIKRTYKKERTGKPDVSDHVVDEDGEDIVDESGFSMKEMVAAQWLTLMGSADMDSLDGSVGSEDLDDGVSSITSAGNEEECDPRSSSATRTTKRQRTGPNKFLDSFVAIYESDQLCTSKKRNDRPPLPPGTAGAAASVGVGSKRKGRGGKSAQKKSDRSSSKIAGTFSNPHVVNAVSKNKFLGVFGLGKRFQAVIDLNGRKYEVPGLFDSDVEAAVARDEFGISTLGISFTPTFGYSSAGPPLYGHERVDGGGTTSGMAEKGSSSKVKVEGIASKAPKKNQKRKKPEITAMNSDWWWDKIAKETLTQ